MTTERTITIDPDSYTAQDVENISDMLCEIIAERYGHLVETPARKQTNDTIPRHHDRRMRRRIRRHA
jgi:hypothetical protein